MKSLKEYLFSRERDVDRLSNNICSLNEFVGITSCTTSHLKPPSD